MRQRDSGMSERKLVIGNKNYSSWSLRPWLAMQVAGIEFEEVQILLDQPDTKEKILEHSPAGKVPILIDGDLTVWESLAILEYLAEAYPNRGLWPEDAILRAEARSVSAEMHAGFGALRDYYPMNMRKRIPGREPTPAVQKDINRILEIWDNCLEASQGPFLFGTFSAADAMFAPVVSRFETYEIPVNRKCRAYMDDVLTIPVLEKWYAAAESEPWILEHDEVE